MNLAHFETVGRIESTKATLASKDDFSLDSFNTSIFQTTNWHYIDDEYPVPEDPTPHKHHNLKEFFLWFHEINLKDLGEKLGETVNKLDEIYNGPLDQRKKLFDDLSQTCDEAQKAYAQAYMIHRRLVDLIEEMDAKSMFRPENVVPVLVKHSLTPQNILIDVVDGTWNVTSIINWTFCETLPEVLAHEAPTWLWNTSTDTTDRHFVWYDPNERAETEEGSEEEYDSCYGSDEEQEMDVEQEMNIEHMNYLVNIFADQPAEETPEVAQNQDDNVEEGPSNAQGTADSASISPEDPLNATPPDDDDTIVKAHFDKAIEKQVPGYLEDAYANGTWSRKLWTQTSRQLDIGFYAEQCEDFISEWEAFSGIPDERRWQRLQPVDPLLLHPIENEDDGSEGEELDEDGAEAQDQDIQEGSKQSKDQSMPQTKDQTSEKDDIEVEEKDKARGIDENVYEGEDGDIFME